MTDGKEWSWPMTRSNHDRWQGVIMTDGKEWSDHDQWQRVIMTDGKEWSWLIARSDHDRWQGVIVTDGKEWSWPMTRSDHDRWQEVIMTLDKHELLFHITNRGLFSLREVCIHDLAVKTEAFREFKFTLTILQQNWIVFWYVVLKCEFLWLREDI